LNSGHGFADYLLYVNGRAAVVVEDKKEEILLTDVQTHVKKQQDLDFDPQN
jgi:type I restriction enzyme R subunit